MDGHPPQGAGKPSARFLSHTAFAPATLQELKFAVFRAFPSRSSEIRKAAGQKKMLKGADGIAIRHAGQEITHCSVHPLLIPYKHKFIGHLYGMLHIILEQRFDNIVTLDLLRRTPAVPINSVKHELPQTVHGRLYLCAHLKVRLVGTMGYDVQDHGVDAFAVRLSKHLQAILWQLERLKYAATQRVIQIVVQIGNAVGAANTLPL